MMRYSTPVFVVLGR